MLDVYRPTDWPAGPGVRVARRAASPVDREDYGVADWMDDGDILVGNAEETFIRSAAPKLTATIRVAVENNKTDGGGRRNLARWRSSLCLTRFGQGVANSVIIKDSLV